MTEQSYPSLFILTTGFIPISIKRLLCNLDYKPMSVVKDWHRQIVLSRDHFSSYLKQHDKKTLFLQTAFVMVVSTVGNMLLTLFQAALIHVNTLITTSQA